MKQKMEASIIHRRVSSDGVYNRMSTQKESGFKEAQELRRLNREQSDLIDAVKEAIKNEGKFTKIQRIRIIQWSERLSTRPNNIVWRKNIIFYLKALVEMINEQKISAPFSSIPAQGALPNLKLLDLPFPIREKLAQKDKIKKQNQSKIKSNQVSVQKVHQKAKSINFNQDLKLDLSLINNSKRNAVKNRKKSSFQSYQASEKRQENKKNIVKLNLKLTADHDKQNDFHLSNNPSVTRRLFDKQTVSENNLLTYNNNQERLQAHNTTVCSFEELDQTTQSHKHRGMSLLLKIYDLINKNADLDDDQQAKSVCSSIHKIADQMGVSLSKDTLNQSNISSISSHFRKASENIRLKFVQTDEQTLQFMSFLHKFRVKNQ